MRIVIARARGARVNLNKQAKNEGNKKLNKKIKAKVI